MRILFILLAFSTVLSGFFLSFEKRFFIESNVGPAQLSETSVNLETIKIILVGDIMLDRGVEYMVKKEGGSDFKFPFLKIADYLQKADIVFANLEGPISDKGKKVGSIYSFRHNPEAIDGLIFAGFNVLSFANNHAFDYGIEALEDNFSRFKVAGIDYVGGGLNESEAYSAVVKEIKGTKKETKIAFLAYTNLGSESWAAQEDRGGIAWVSGRDLEKVKQDIAKAKSEADILIISLHAGEEYTQNLTDFQKEFAKTVIDAGADLVVGHHPHVVQKSEQYNGKWIFYSLGNFVFDQGFSKKTMQGQLVEIILNDGKIKEVIPREIKINNFFQPELIK